eukprot:CAMPEP_0206203612 /NCGR_PEP_ID=MMETSP0166-20121206/12960_1 /ASSEMBLY_ACC=CAM_ASM_000260 /TAXON_ID=95228 /ORGANISM="Vannella robusta, Strain DIVA3 518/3/11/1/6" /LENGTH=66 /DNA_ID=CAMNT_0053622937 /DNA_START=574 /DNA_END=774 /DNA_ORIENTATION=+
MASSSVVSGTLENSYRNALSTAQSLAADIHETVKQIRSTEEQIQLLQLKIQHSEKDNTKNLMEIDS